MSDFSSEMKSSGRWRRRRSPAGVTLVEAMVVVAVSSVILGMTAALLVSLKRADRNLRLAGVQNARMIELAERLRSDIRRGADISQPAENVLLVSTAAGEQRRYEVGREGCRRSVVLPDAPDARSDLFAIGPGNSWRIEEGPPGQRRLLIVTLNRPRPDDANTGLRRTPLLVFAALGADVPIAAAASPSSDVDEAD
jgi:hypothetical protein